MCCSAKAGSPVACESDDDLPYVVQYAGEESIVIGSDYGYSDTSSELEALRRPETSGDLPATLARKILAEKARLYAL